MRKVAVEIAQDKDESDALTVTLRGDAAVIVKMLVEGLPREALMEISEALATELARRKEER